MRAADPALAFFLRFVELEGGLVEEGSDHALAVIPTEVCSALQAQEEQILTADPEVAREGEATLLIPGHPLLDAAVSRVLDRGDVGRVWIPWPASAPDSSTLLERVRARFPVDHGRVDPAGEIIATYMCVLRAGALATFALSLDQRFQEQVEVWIDAATGLELDSSTIATLQARGWAPRPATDHPTGNLDLPAGMETAWSALERIAERRLESLAAQTGDEKEAERAQAEAYYAAQLASLERRKKAAPPDRVTLLDARVAVTLAERERRLVEIEEKHRPSLQTRPFRLHVVAAPSLTIPLLVRRGDRAYPFRARWLLGAGAFAPERCPACMSTEPLVAGRDRLGCAACLPRTAAITPAPPVTPPRHAELRTATPASHPSSERRNDQARTREKRTAEKPRSRGHATRTPAGARARAALDPDPERVQKEGLKLATRFWETAAAGDRWSNKLLAPDSPARALYRLFGPAAPFAAVGIGLDEMVIRWSAATAPPYRDLPEATTGSVLTDAGTYFYTLRWRRQEGRSVLLEILPHPRVADGRLPPDASLAPRAAQRLFVEVPHPREPLSGVARELWERTLPVAGLPVVARCLVAYWRLPLVPAASDPVLADALVRVVGKHPRRGTKPNPATDEVDVVASELRRILKPSSACPW